MSPKEFDKVTVDDPDLDISDFSKLTGENTGQFGVSAVFEFSVVHVSHDDFAVQIESKESMPSGNRCFKNSQSQSI